MNKIKLGLVLSIVFAFASCNVVLAADVLNPNYGTTTFFSEKSEKPSDNPPVYDVGVKAGKKSPKDDVKKDDDNDDGLFDQIVDGIGGLFGGASDPTYNSEDDSLFDLQKDSNNGDSYDDSENDGEFIMGARGENLENLSDEEAAKYNSRISSGFNFRDNSTGSAPKKSKLLFTNIIIPVNMTTQYVLVGLVFFIAVGSVVGYYLWKKESANAKKDLSEENYD